MKAIMVMFDSLNRHMLPPYGCDWIHAPNFKRLAEKTVTFNHAYVGSLPCMPARRDLHTGRYSFLHRSWGPLEPFDHSMPEILKNNGVYTHLVSDHQHYWEDGGANYHTRYSSWENVRGQEGDPWKGHVEGPTKEELQQINDFHDTPFKRQDMINRGYYKEEEKHPQAVTFRKGLEFIDTNKDADQWFLQIETFDPHEPFTTYQKYKDLYPHDYDGPQRDWPPYYYVQEDDETVEHVRYEYAALVSMCDHYLGKVLDKMDKYDMWKDTMLIVNTDHGYLLGEHGWWAKSVMPVYQEIAHIPFFMWNPRLGMQGEECDEIVQLIDIAPTLLEYFNVDIPEEMTGQSISKILKEEVDGRDSALFGYHGGHVNLVNKEHVYMRGPIRAENTPLFEFTLMPAHMKKMFSTDSLKDIELEEPFSFTRGAKVMKIETTEGFVDPFQYGSKLFDIKQDPEQKNEIEDLEKEQTLIKKMAEIMREHDAPKSQYERLGIPENGEISIELLKKQRKQVKESAKIGILQDVPWTREAENKMRALLNITPKKEREAVLNSCEHYCYKENNDKVTGDLINQFVDNYYERGEKEEIIYFINLAGRVK